MPIKPVAKKNAGRKKIPVKEKLVVVSFGISPDELKLLEFFRKEYGFKNLSSAIRKIVRDEMYAKIKYVHLSGDEIKKCILENSNEVNSENLFAMVVDNKK